MHHQQPGLRATFLSGACALFLLLSACGGGSSGGGTANNPPTGNNDVTAPLASVTPETNLGIRESIVITFDEAMDPESLVLGGFLADISDDGAWSEGNTVLTLSPDELDAWESGVQNLTVDATDEAGNALDTLDVSFEVRLNFENFQSASVVIGQADFSGNQNNQGGTVDANTLEGPYGVAWDSESNSLYLIDDASHRLLGFNGIPDSNNANADFVIGQDDFTATTSGLSASKLNFPYLVTAANGQLFVNDYSNNRVVIYDPAPNAGGAIIDTVIGQVNKTSDDTGCTSSNFSTIESIGVTPDGKVLVQDWTQDRTLIFNATPTADGASADLVLGQDDFVTCANNPAASASSLEGHGGIWTDGEKLVMLNWTNSRVLIWNEFPNSDNEEADIVLGQPDFTSTLANDPDTAALSARMMRPYSGVWSNGLQLIVADSGNNRLLIWNTFPTSNFAAADIVLGQGDFTHGTANDDDQDGIEDATPTARVFSNSPQGLIVARDKLVLADSDNNRVLVFESN